MYNEYNFVKLFSETILFLKNQKVKQLNFKK